MTGSSDLPVEKCGKTAMCVVLLLAVMSSMPVSLQSNPKLQEFFRNIIGLTEDQIAAIESGRAVVKTLPSRSPAEVLLFGAVYIPAAPESYVEFAHDFDRFRKLPNYLAFGVFTDPPQLSNLIGFSLEDDEITALRKCEPRDCLIQVPASLMEQVQRTVDWSSATANQQVNDLLRKTALDLLTQFETKGNQALGVYHDKTNPTDVPQQFAYMLSYASALPQRLPDFHRYLLTYPENKPGNVDNIFYWEKVKFGLKPTLRIVQRITMRGRSDDAVACAIAEKQLYASHYFETALDLSFCVRLSEDSSKPGFYLIKEMGSKQAGLTGVKGSIIRKTAVGRSLSNLQAALTAIRNVLTGRAMVVR